LLQDLEKLSSNLSEEQLEKIKISLDEDYDNFTAELSRFAYQLNEHKFELTDLDLTGIEYEKVKVEDPDGMGIWGVHGVINNEYFRHITFKIREYEEEIYLADFMIGISEDNPFETRNAINDVKLSSNEDGFVFSNGTVHLNKSAGTKEILNCMIDSPFIFVGIEESSKDLPKEETDYDYLKGKWSFSFYINNVDIYVGEVEWKFEIKVFPDHIEYLYFDFIHSKATSEYKSIGMLPLEPNEAVLKVFSKEEYQQIIDYVLYNQKMFVGKMKKFTDKCFE